MFKRLLVPTDGSSLSLEAIEKAILLAKEMKAQITFFFAQEDDAASLYGDAALLRSTDPQLFDDAKKRQIEKALSVAQAMAREMGISSSALSAVSNEPFKAIIAAAEECGCDLILMASHGRKGVEGLLLGSQTQKVLTHSKIPVLVYR